MIDVVFLLLVFFMLAARFGQTGAIPLSTGGVGAYDGPPRLVEIAPNGLKLNGVFVSIEDLAEEMSALTSSPADIIVLRPVGGVELQRLVNVVDLLGRAGFSAITLIEPSQ
jgi:biopolymer transport protein ExbD